MQLTKEDIEEFKFLYVKHYNQDLSDDEAWILAHNLIHFFSLITELPPKKLLVEAKTPSEKVKSCDHLR